MKTILAVLLTFALVSPLFAAPKGGSDQVKVVQAYMVKGCTGPVVTGSVALIDERFSAYYLPERVEIKDGQLKLTCNEVEGNREIPICKDIAQLFDSLKPGVFTTMMPWSGLSPVEGDSYWVTALDDRKLCLALPGDNPEFAIPDEKGKIETITPFPCKGILAAVSAPILSPNVIDGMHPNLEGIDVATHKILWSFPCADDGLNNLTWINFRYLLGTIHSRHWDTFVVYDVKRQKRVAKGSQSDHDIGTPNEKPYVRNWRVTRNKVIAYYGDGSSPRVVFNGGK